MFLGFQFHVINILKSYLFCKSIVYGFLFCFLCHIRPSEYFNNLASSVVFVAPALPKYNVSSGFFISSVGTIIWSSLNVRPHLFVYSSNVNRYASGAMFFSPCLVLSLILLSSASVADFAIRVFKSSIKLKSAAFLIVSPVAFLSPVFLSSSLLT